MIRRLCPRAVVQAIGAVNAQTNLEVVLAPDPRFPLQA
jgi:hypothetical protein